MNEDQERVMLNELASTAKSMERIANSIDSISNKLDLLLLERSRGSFSKVEDLEGMMRAFFDLREQLTKASQAKTFTEPGVQERLEASRPMGPKEQAFWDFWSRPGAEKEGISEYTFWKLSEQLKLAHGYTKSDSRRNAQIRKKFVEYFERRDEIPDESISEYLKLSESGLFKEANAVKLNIRIPEVLVDVFL